MLPVFRRLAALFVLGYAVHLAQAQPSISFSFANGSIVEEDGRQYAAFDVMAAASQPVRLGDTQLYLDYNPAVFGTGIAAAGRVAVHPGALLSDRTRYSIRVRDNESDGGAKLSIVGSYLAFPNEQLGSLISDTAQVLYHIRIALTAATGTTNLRFDNDCAVSPCMEGQQFLAGGDRFSSVTAGPPLDLSVEITSSPTAVADSATTAEDTPVTIDVLRNDAGGSLLQVIGIVSAPAHGSAVVNADGTITYTPASDFFGNDRFRYAVRDPDGNQAQAGVFVTVTPVNDPPRFPAGSVFTHPAPGSEILLGGAPAAPIVFAWREATDPEGEPVRYTWQLSRSTSFTEILAEHSLTSPKTEMDAGSLAELLKDIEPGATATLYARLIASDGSAETVCDPEAFIILRSAFTSTEETGMPAAFALEQNYPNPFNPATTIGFSLPQAGDVELSVFDLLGRRVAVLASGHHPQGRTEVTWDASAFPSGVYVSRLQAGTRVETRRMILQK